MKLVFVATLFLASTVLGSKSYDGYKVIRVDVPNEDSAKLLRRFQDMYDFWTDILPGRATDIMIPPGNGLPNLLRESGFAYSTMIEDVQPLFNAQKAAPKSSRQSDWWTAYHTFDDITAKMEELAAGRPDVADVIEIGSSYEGRIMKVVRVCSTGNCGDNPGMYLQSGIHAREWISPAVNTWMLNELLYSPIYDNYVKSLDWYFLANVNPDGYSYTWTDDRMWRKTRQPNEGALCIGTDPNRNFNAGWGDTVGSSDSPCSDAYHGPAVWSEPETNNVRRYFEEELSNIKFFNDLHSYSQIILFPWGYKQDHSNDYTDHDEAATAGAQAIKQTHGMTYTHGNAWDAIYPATGIAVDWAYDIGVKYSISVELRDTGTFGFTLPPNQIIPCAEESWAMHLTYADRVLQEFGQK